MRLYELLTRQDDETLGRLAAEHLGPEDVQDRATRCFNLELVLRSPRHVRTTLFNRRPPCFWIVSYALANGCKVPLNGLKESATGGTARITDLANNEELAGKREHRELYRRVLAEAWRSDSHLDPSEISLLAVLRHELGLTNVDHFLIEHHRDLHPFWNTDHAFLDVLNGLRSSGLFHVVEGDLVLPSDLESVVRQVVGIEASTESSRRLYTRLGSEDLAEALEASSLKTSGSKGDRVQRLLDAGVQPSFVLQRVGLANLKGLCSDMRLKTSGSKDALIDRLVEHFGTNADIGPGIPAPQPPPPEPRRLSSEGFQVLFAALRGQDLSDILASIDSRRVTGAKEHLIELLQESPFAEDTLLRKLDSKQLDGLLARFDLRSTGNKGERLERLLQEFERSRDPATGKTPGI